MKKKAEIPSNLNDKLAEILGIIRSIDDIDPAVSNILMEGFALSINTLRVVIEKGNRDEVDISDQIQFVSKALGVSLEDIVKQVMVSVAADTAINVTLVPSGTPDGAIISHGGKPGGTCTGCGGKLDENGMCQGSVEGNPMVPGQGPLGAIGQRCSGCGGIINANGTCDPATGAQYPTGKQNTAKAADNATLDFITGAVEDTVATEEDKAKVDDYEKFLAEEKAKAKASLDFLSKQI
jgi:hypothetical protein